MSKCYPNHKIINILEKGTCFGEIAVRTEGIRTATVVCTENCHFGTLTSDIFNKILNGYFEIK